MSSFHQLVSEIAHSLKQFDSVPVRRAIKRDIIHARNDLIRKSFSNHRYTDKVLQQRFRLELIDIPDGDLSGSNDLYLTQIKRTKSKVPRPTRLTNNLPFHSVRTAGVKNPIEIAFVKEASSNFYNHLPGFCPHITYDYINEYIYINNINTNIDVGSIIIESVFEYPHIIQTETSDGGVLDIDSIDDYNEFLLPEDMIPTIKQMVLSTFNVNVIRDTAEVNKANIVK